MLSNITTNLNTTIPINAAQSIQSMVHSVRFLAYLISNILSLVCTLFDLFFLLSDRTLYHALNNHVIIVLLFLGLFYETTNIPWILYNDYNGAPLFRSNIFYYFWTYINYSFYSLQIELFAWATIERHILIFHDQWVSTGKKRFLVHYLPIIIIIVYYLIYFAIVHFVQFCTSSFEPFLAGGIHIPCVFDHTVLGMWDLNFHQVVPTLVIVFFSMGLLARSIWQKRRLQQSINWRKHRKMIIQLLSISTIYIVFNAPWVLVIFGYQYGLPPDIAGVALVYTGFLYYYVIFVFPFVCCLSLPELRKKFRMMLFCWRQTRQVNPTTTGITRTQGGRTART